MSPKLHSVALSLLGLAVAFVSAGCGSSAGSPAGPSAAGVPLATIDGSVDTGSGVSSASFQPVAKSKPALTVSAMGTGRSTTTDASGHFTLTGVPAGAVTLRFQGPGIDATLEISGLAAGQVLTINVHVSGSHASLAPAGGSPSPSPGDDDQEAEVKGPIASIGADNIVVSGKTIMVAATTQIEGDHHTTLAFTDLKVGDVVEVEGTLQADGTVLAAKIQVESENNDDQGEVELQGKVDSITPPTLQVAGRVVTTNATTHIEGNGAKSLSDIHVGDTVDVRGLLQADSSILATKIQLKSGSSNGDDQGDDDGGDDDNGGDDGGDDGGGN